MRLKSARQAWFIAFYDGKQNTMVDTLMLGCFIQKTNSLDTTAIAINQWIAGKVQNAIASLLPPLQHLGNYLYKPEFSKEDLKIAHELIKIGLFEKYSGQIWSTNKLDRVDALIYAVMEDYKAMVVSGLKNFKSYNEMCLWIANRFNININHTHWHRDWQEIYNNIMSICNDFDKIALIPVSEVVRDYKKINKEAA